MLILILEGIVTEGREDTWGTGRDVLALFLEAFELDETARTA